MVYKFRAGAHVPTGVSAADVIAERDKIAKSKGEASVEVVTDAVEHDPKKYATLAKFLTWDTELAARKQHEQEIRFALNSVMIVEQIGSEKIEARALVITINEKGNREYEHTEVVLVQDDKRDVIFEEIESTLREATTKVSEFRKLDKFLRAQAKVATAVAA